MEWNSCVQSADQSKFYSNNMTFYRQIHIMTTLVDQSLTLYVISHLREYPCSNIVVITHHKSFQLKCVPQKGSDQRDQLIMTIYSIYPFVHIQLIFQTLFEAHIVARRKYDLTFASMVRNACNLMMHIYNDVSSEKIKSLV